MSVPVIPGLPLARVRHPEQHVEDPRDDRAVDVSRRPLVRGPQRDPPADRLAVALDSHRRRDRVVLADDRIAAEGCLKVIEVGKLARAEPALGIPTQPLVDLRERVCDLTHLFLRHVGDNGVIDQPAHRVGKPVAVPARNAAAPAAFGPLGH